MFAVGNENIRKCILLFPLVFFSCTKETLRIETRVVPERQAAPAIGESLSASADAKSIEIKKAALGRAFLLMPVARSSGRTPGWEDFRPLVVSFERSGSKVGLFKLTSDNVYKTIPTDKLLQSFSILKESEESLLIDLASGIKSLDMSSSLEIIEAESFAKDFAKSLEGAESAIEVKDSFVRSVQQKGNSIVIEQVARLSSEEIELESSAIGVNEEAPVLNKQEITMTFVFELKPYFANPNFATPQLMDAEQRIGFFVNFAFKEGKSLPDPQISRWDLSPQRAPVTVALLQGTPEEVIPAIREGIEYWNHVLGREVLKIQTGIDAKTNPQDRMIIVRWVPWDTAGFAYASAQSDPLTGEVLRGQVFMTSSWYLHGFESFRWPEEFGMKPATSSWQRHSRLCTSMQKDFGMNEAFFQSSPQVQKKVSLEMVRVVLAHEIGHVLGLRHNFSASSVFSGSDRELLERKQNYLSDMDAGKDGKNITYPLATSVMDYHPALETAMIGTYIKDQTLPYDVEALGWAYNNKPMTARKYDYCSDEHIMMANRVGRAIFGCERFDGFKNPVMGAMYQFRRELMNLSLRPFAKRVSDLQNQDPYRPVQPMKDSDVFFSTNSAALKAFLYANPSKSGMVSIQTIIDKMISNLAILPRSLPLFLYGEDQKFVEQLQVATKELGGLSSILSSLLPPEAERGQFAQSQTERFFSLVSKHKIDNVTTDELANMKEIFLKAAEKFDKDYELQVLNDFLPVFVKTDYSISKNKSFDPTETPKKTYLYLSRSIDLGKQTELFERYRKAAVLRENEFDVVAYGKRLKLKVLNNQSYQRRDLMKIFVPENWGIFLQYSVSNALNSQKELLKQDLIANSLLLLEAAKIEIAKPLSSQNLKSALEKIDWTQVQGVQNADALLQNEVVVLELLEGLKKEEN